MTVSTRLAELLAMCEEPESSPDYTLRGKFILETMNYQLYDKEFQPCGILTPWDWWVIPELLAYCEAKGLPVPVDPSLDIRTIW